MVKNRTCYQFVDQPSNYDNINEWILLCFSKTTQKSMCKRVEKKNKKKKTKKKKKLKNKTNTSKNSLFSKSKCLFFPSWPSTSRTKRSASKLNDFTANSTLIELSCWPSVKKCTLVWNHIFYELYTKIRTKNAPIASIRWIHPFSKEALRDPSGETHDIYRNKNKPIK